ncbi:hypothetical protein GQ53DRAFT_703768 [Thozetella sp. PMI_491]|nr:hypothetical protein GQ53DRAFT_703768 [Thozetella sp. PMI_491]
MFPVFVDVLPPSVLPGQDNSGPQPATDSGSDLAATPAQVRPKRKQVSRACDWCRAHRALREVEQLRERVKQLEAEATARHNGEARTHAASRSQHGSQEGTDLTRTTLARPSQRKGSRRWEGVYFRSCLSHTSCYYGPASVHYFLVRISSFLVKELSQNPSSYQVQLPKVEGAQTLPYPGAPADYSDDHAAITSRASKSLSRTREGFYLALYRHFLQWAFPIFDEREFQAHYDSLWDPTGTVRKPSALVDIVLALCMQCGHSLLPKTPPGGDGTTEPDVGIPGRWFYRRCQALLAREFESPSMTTLQCQIFSAIYLSSAMFSNMAHSTLATAVRTAQALGLHLEPPPEMPLLEREQRKRAWWMLLVFEGKMSMKLGRPFAVSFTEFNCSLPSDSQEIAALAAPTVETGPAGVTWLSYNVQLQKLVISARAVYTALDDGVAAVLEESGARSPYDDPELLEACAKSLTDNMYLLESWLERLPSELKTKRRASGEPFSCDRTPLSIDLQAPLWLQRQRIWLELLYHTLTLNLHRPFVNFVHRQGGYSPVAEAHAASCIRHAITHTQIIHQVLSETDLLSGWVEAFQWQWNAAMTIVGFLIAYPISPSSVAARRAADKSVEVFELLAASNMSVAASSADIVRDMLAKSDLVNNRFRTGFSGPTPEDAPDPTRPDEDGGSIVGLGMAPNLATRDVSDFSDFLDMALSVDSFNNFDHLLHTDTEILGR